MDNLNAVVRILTETAASGGAGATELPLQAGPGKLWKVLYLWVVHTAGGNRAGGWYWKDTDTAGGTPAGIIHAALVPSVPLMFPGMAAVGTAGGEIQPIEPFWVSNTSYPVFAWTATAGAENASLKALVLEYSGTGKTG